MINPGIQRVVIEKAKRYLELRNTSESETVCIYHNGEIYDANPNTGEVKMYTKQWHQKLADVQSRL